jgi:photosystem II stability/assembly factor-like uncharacterized protein
MAILNNAPLAMKMPADAETHRPASRRMTQGANPMTPFQHSLKPRPRSAFLFGLMAAVLVAALSCGPLSQAQAAQAAWGSPLSQPALMIGNPQDVAILGLSQAGARYVGVGENGVIIYSDDHGAHWSQAASPVTVTLTSVHFVTSTEGFATGHFGVVLRTNDAGKNWTLALDGITAANLALDQARHLIAASPRVANAATDLSEAQRLVKSGPDKPFFDSYFSDAKTGFVVGAYNLIYRTTDGGDSWTAWMSHVENAKRLHLYAIAAGVDAIYIAGEQGLLLRSTDAGQSFQAVQLPYSGSFFSIAVGPGNDVVVAGMEGYAFHSASSTSTWQQIPNLPPVSIVAVSFDARGHLWLANQTGEVFFSPNAGQSLTPLPPQAGPPPPPFTSIMPLADAVLAGTVAGVQRLAVAKPSLVAGAVSNGS